MSSFKCEQDCRDEKLVITNFRKRQTLFLVVVPPQGQLRLKNELIQVKQRVSGYSRVVQFVCYSKSCLKN